MSAFNSEVNDPLLCYFDSTKTGLDESVEEDEGNIVPHRSFLWRQNKEESFSDWTIVLIAQNSHEQKENDNQETSIEQVQMNEVSDTENQFHVHRNILSSVSVYFKSQFSAQVETVEKRNSTSTIHLHQKALEAFPVFLDYLYNPYEGKSGFCVENAVALRHLAMYFGVDMLLKDITDIIVTDMKRRDSRKIYFEEAKIFYDHKLLEAIKPQDMHQESLYALAPVVYKVIIDNAFTVTSTNDSDAISAWKHIMANLDYDHDPFFAAKKADHFIGVCATGAGYAHANGIYNLVASADGVGEYSNGICILYRVENSQWKIGIGYLNKTETWDGKILYKCESNSDQPPSKGWKSSIGNVSLDTCPTFTVMPNLKKRKY